MTTIESLCEKLRAKPKPAKTHKDRLSCGLWLLNLACSGDPDWCISKGDYLLLVGDAASGKTWVALQLLAEASINPQFSKYLLLHNNPERGARMDKEKYFGTLPARLIEPEGGSSRTIQGFYDHMIDMDRAGKPFIEVLDSEDALDDENEIKKAKTNKKARVQENGKVKGSYGGVGKAKENSSRLRTAHNSLDDQGSILVIIKQTRDNIGFGAQFNPKTRSGGRALTFYSTAEFWFSIFGKIKKSVMGKKRIIGSILRIHVKRTRLFGRDRTVDVRFFPNHGFDNTGSCIHWLIGEKHWKASKEEDSTDDNLKLEAPEFDWKGSVDGLARKIEAEGREGELKDIVTAVWNEIEAGCNIQRKNPYQREE